MGSTAHAQQVSTQSFGAGTSELGDPDTRGVWGFGARLATCTESLFPASAAFDLCPACCEGLEGLVEREGLTGVGHRPASRCSSKGASSSESADTMSNMENKTTQITEAAAVVLDTVVRCTETDVNGHLNNAKFVEYLEWGREEWYESQGFGYDRLGELGAITVVVNINLDYRQSCHQGDRLRIVTSPQRRGRSSFALAQRIERTDATVVAEGVVTIVTVDPDTRRPVPLPEEFAEVFGAPD